MRAFVGGGWETFGGAMLMRFAVDGPGAIPVPVSSRTLRFAVIALSLLGGSVIGDDIELPPALASADRTSCTISPLGFDER